MFTNLASYGIIKQSNVTAKIQNGYDQTDKR